jgi:hypothetical protein
LPLASRKKARRLDFRPGILGKDAKLIEKTRPRAEELPETATAEAPTAPDVPVNSPGNGVASSPVNGRRERVSSEDSVDVEPAASEAIAPGSGDSSQAVESSKVANPDRESRRIARAEKRGRPRAPLAEKSAAQRDSATDNEDNLPEDSPPAADAAPGAAEAPVVDLSGENNRRGARAARRARTKQQAAAAVMKAADDHPAIGALNRHLSVMTQQLGTAHRVLGRVVAERDAFRQQLADLQGIPIDAIPVTSLDPTKSRRSSAKAGQSANQSGSPVQGIAVAVPGQPGGQSSIVTDADEPSSPSFMSRLNYFSVDDIAVARKRRQTFALGLLLVVLILGLAIRLGIMRLPDNLSRESLTAIPLIGDFFSVFLAGWIFFRFIRISSKGVKWVFPSEDQKRRRR